MTDYSSEAQAVADAMNAVYENKQTNKKNDISGDYSSDNASYPTVKAVQAAYGTKVNSWSSTVSDSNIPSEKLTKDTLDTKQATLVSGTNIKTVNNNSLLGSGNITIDGLSGNIVTSWQTTTSDSKVPSEKLVKDSLDGKASSTHAHGSISSDGKLMGSGGAFASGTPLITAAGGLIYGGSFGTTAGTFAAGNHTHSAYAVTLEEQQTAETGYSKTYVIKQGGTALSPKINIPKDFLVKSGSVKTCTTANVPVQGYVVGDKYIDFVINAKDSSATDEHLYILVSDLIDTYTADNTTLQVSNNQFSIKNSGVDTTQLKDGAVTSDKIASAVKNSWLSTSDVQSEISAFASALAEAINPTTT